MACSYRPDTEWERYTLAGLWEEGAVGRAYTTTGEYVKDSHAVAAYKDCTATQVIIGMNDYKRQLVAQSLPTSLLGYYDGYQAHLAQSVTSPPLGYLKCKPSLCQQLWDEMKEWLNVEIRLGE